MQKWWKGLLLMAGAASAATAGGTAYFYRRVMKRNRMKVEDTMKMSGTDWSRYADLLKERKAWMMSQPHEEAEIMSEYGLKLHGTFFPGTGGAKKLAICLHGYTSQGMSDYIREVKEGVFPAPEHKYKISGDIAEFEKLFEEMAPRFGE